MLIRFATILVMLAAAHSLMGGTAAGRENCTPRIAIVTVASNQA